MPMILPFTYLEKLYKDMNKDVSMLADWFSANKLATNVSIVNINKLSCQMSNLK